MNSHTLQHKQLHCHTMQLYAGPAVTPLRHYLGNTLAPRQCTQIARGHFSTALNPRRRETLDSNPHSTLYTRHYSPLYTLHYTHVPTLHSTLDTRHYSPFYTLHQTLHATINFTLLYILHIKQALVINFLVLQRRRRFTRSMEQRFSLTQPSGPGQSGICNVCPYVVCVLYVVCPLPMKFILKS